MSAKLSNNSHGQATRLRTGRVRLSFPHLFERDQMSGKYSATILIDKNDEETVSLMKEAVKNAKADGTERLWGGKEPSQLRMIVRDGDKSEHEEEHGCYTISAKSNSRIDVYGKGGVLLDDEDDIYGGCYVQAVIEFFPYNNQGKGISCTLEGIKKVADGERFGGGSYKAGADDFDDDGDDDDDLI